MGNAAAQNHVIVERRGAAAVVRGRFELLNDDGLKSLRQSIDASARVPDVSLVVVDLSRVEILRSKELGALVQIFNGCKARQQRMKLAGATSRVRGILSIAHLDQLMELNDSVEAALE